MWDCCAPAAATPLPRDVTAGEPGWGSSVPQLRAVSLAPKASGRRQGAVGAAEGLGAQKRDQPGLMQTDPNPGPQLTLGPEWQRPEPSARWGGAHSSCSWHPGLFVAKLPALHLRMVQNTLGRGSAETGKPFVWDGSHLSHRREDNGPGLAAPTGAPAAPPSAWEVGERRKGQSRGPAASRGRPGGSGSPGPRRGGRCLASPARPARQKAQPGAQALWELAVPGPRGRWACDKSLLPPRPCSLEGLPNRPLRTVTARVLRLEGS